MIAILVQRDSIRPRRLELRNERSRIEHVAMLAFGPFTIDKTQHLHVIQIGKAAWQVAQEGDARQTEQAFQTLADTRRTLYRILAQDSDPADEEAEDTV